MPDYNFYNFSDRPIRRAPAGTLLDGEPIAGVNPERFWKKQGDAVRVHKYLLNGQIYLGQGLLALSGLGTEPALIDPLLPVSSSGVFDLSLRRSGYWPSYSTLSFEARGAYLQWLSQGRKAPNADIGLVFLFFYGLERRALADPLISEVSAEEIEAIRLEVKRLLSIYQHRSSFKGYAQSFIEVLQLRNIPERLYQKALPKADSFELIHKVALSQCAMDRAPLPLHWALAWLELDPQMKLPSVAQRCRREFRELFALRYREQFGAGAVLSPGRTPLRVPYSAASPSFQGLSHFIGFKSDLLEVNAFCESARSVHDLAEECCQSLSGYARSMLKSSHGGITVDPVFELPFVLWPQRQKNAIERLRLELKGRNKPLTLSFEALKDKLGEHFSLSKTQWRKLIQRLGEAGIGVEPGATVSGSLPSTIEYVSLFVCENPKDLDRAVSESYIQSAVAVQFVAAVDFIESGRSFDQVLLLQAATDRFSLPEHEHPRLAAHLARITAEGPKTKGLKPLISTIAQSDLAEVGEFVVLHAMRHGIMTDTRRRVLENVFTALSLSFESLPEVPPPAPEEPLRVQPADSVRTEHPIRPVGPVFSLDRGKIRQLESETRQVAALLSDIFSAEEEPQTSSVLQSRTNDPRHSASSGLWGLDEAHSRFARMLSKELSWSRETLQGLADEQQLMLDGALELINETCLEATGEMFIEGFDPIEICCDLVKEQS